MPSVKDDLIGRINALGLAVLVIIGILAARLWYLQVLAGESYAALAEDNRLREVSVESPRGLIYDSHGDVIVGNRAALAVTAAPRTLEDTRLVTRLSQTLGVEREEIVRRLSDKRPDPLKPRRIAEDVDMRTATAILERQSLYPGVEVHPLAARRYPYPGVASHALGYIGELSDVDLTDADFKRYEYGDIVGKTGIERRYESVLQGEKGFELLEVNAGGRPLRVVRTSDPSPGRSLQLTIDRRVQATTERLLARAVLDARRGKYKKARAGAAVVMDVKTGAIVAIASYPSYDPSAFLGGIPHAAWKRLNDPKSEYPLFNRAITGAYPPGSTFKPVTALAGLGRGIIGRQTSFDCEGKWTGMGQQWPKWCWRSTGHHRLSFVDAMADSCNVYFYNIGYAFYRRDVQEVREELQDYARKAGFGSKTGIDIAGEVRGRIPDHEWKAAFNKNSPQYAPWLPGDTVNLAIGQGDVLATPLQMCRAYAAIANGGTLHQPYLVARILTPSGLVSHVTRPTVVGRLPISPTKLALVREGLEAVTSYGTAAEAFEGFPYRVGGKTGTSQVVGKDDYALFAGYAPASDPKYAAVVVVEQGGHGGSAAAPAVRNIFAALLGAPESDIRPDDESR